MNREFPNPQLFLNFTPEPTLKPPPPSAELVSADQFTIDELTEAYNETRVDYMVPMPMNAARLREYIHLYQLDLSQSFVVMDEGKKVGLGMLGIRPGRSWITRLGLVASTRGKGIGKLLMKGLLANSDKLGIEKTMLEVIHGNDPAHRLFKKFGFEDQWELLILRRAPGEVSSPNSEITWMEIDECIEKLKTRPKPIAWTNQTLSLENAKGVTGFKIQTSDGRSGWIVFQRTLFNLSRLMFQTDGDSPEVMKDLLGHLHSHYPNVDTYTENIPALDPHMPAFEEFGYLEAFRRVEMYRFP